METYRDTRYREKSSSYERRKARNMWKKHNGDIPKGYEIHHVNFDPLDHRIENLICISREKHRELHKNCMQSDVAKRHRMESNGKIVCQYSLNGELIAEYVSARECSRQTGFGKDPITNSCNGTRKRHGHEYKGYLWYWKGDK